MEPWWFWSLANLVQNLVSLSDRVWPRSSHWMSKDLENSRKIELDLLCNPILQDMPGIALMTCPPDIGNFQTQNLRIVPLAQMTCQRWPWCLFNLRTASRAMGCGHLRRQVWRPEWLLFPSQGVFATAFDVVRWHQSKTSMKTSMKLVADWLKKNFSSPKRGHLGLGFSKCPQPRSFELQRHLQEAQQLRQQLAVAKGTLEHARQRLEDRALVFLGEDFWVMAVKKRGF